MDYINLLGICGAAIILVFFLLNQMHRIDRDGLVYDIGNFMGASILIVYAILIASVPFAFLNGVWALFSLKDIFSDIFSKRK